MRWLVLAVALFLVTAGSAQALDTPTQPVYDSRGRIIETPLAPPEQSEALTQKRAIAIFLAHPKVREWLKRYPGHLGETADFSSQYRYWTVIVSTDEAGWIAKGKVDDATSRVTEALTGPQVAWGMARGVPGAFGGKKINSYPVWLAFCAVFLLGLLDWRRPFSLRNLDLVVLLSFSVSLWFFNHGRIFASASLAYPPLVYLIGRGLWIGITGRASPGTTRWPVWLLLAVTAFGTGFRLMEYNVRNSNVIDVGYSGVIGAERIVHGEWPYGHMPDEDGLKACGPANEDGEIRERIQTNGRCESANPRGDTYGPVAYESYIPGYLARGWSGKWDDLPAAHATVIAFDLICLLGLGLVGLRLGGPLFGATLAFAWSAYPFTQYASSSNTNDTLLPAFLIWGFLLLTSPWARGAGAALAGWTKFAALVVAPMWVTYRLTRRQIARAAGGFAVATLAAFSIVLLEPDVGHALRVFWERTFSWQLTRESPFSIWDWRQYHAKGLPNLEVLQRFFQALVVAAALGFALVPRRKTPLQLAALTGVLLLGFELVLTHWSYLYIPWFFPFVAYATLAPREPAPPQPQPDEQPVPELVAAG